MAFPRLTAFAPLLAALLLAAAPSWAAPGPPRGGFPATAPAALLRVELYSTAWCPGCNAARTWLDANAVPYVDYDVERDPEALARFRRMNPTGTVPYAVIDGKGYAGFDPDRYARLVGAR